MAFKRALLLAIALLMLTTGAVAAAFVSTLQANGTWNEAELRQFIGELKDLRKFDGSQVRIVEVRIDAAGTGWHSHAGAPSLLIVESGQIDYIRPAKDGGCETTRLMPGAMISHPQTTHDLRAVGGDAVFTVVYFSAVGAPLLQVDPPAC